MSDILPQSLVPVAQYLRMSKEHQRYSIRNQARAISDYAGQHGFTIVKTYTDPGESGLTLRERPGLQALLADVVKPARPFERVLVLDVSRWGRFQNLDQSGHYEFICFEAGVGVIGNALSITPGKNLTFEARNIDGEPQITAVLAGLIRSNFTIRSPDQSAWEKSEYGSLLSEELFPGQLAVQIDGHGPTRRCLSFASDLIL